MWGTFLSEPLPIVAPVGRYPAGWLIGRMPIRSHCFLLKHDAVLKLHGVLIALSEGNPTTAARLHTRYSPVRRSPAKKASFLPAAPRLACVRPVASVHPEPGSNSSFYFLCTPASRDTEAGTNPDPASLFVLACPVSEKNGAELTADPSLSAESIPHQGVGAFCLVYLFYVSLFKDLLSSAGKFLRFCAGSHAGQRVTSPFLRVQRYGLFNPRKTFFENFFKKKVYHVSRQSLFF